MRIVSLDSGYKCSRDDDNNDSWDSLSVDANCLLLLLWLILNRDKNDAKVDDKTVNYYIQV